MWTPERFFEEHRVPENYEAQLEAVKQFVARHKEEGRRVVLVTVRFVCLLTRAVALLLRLSAMCELLLTVCATWPIFPLVPVVQLLQSTSCRRVTR